jgi:hypothetical protein
MTVSFNATSKEIKLIDKIVNRAVSMKLTKDKVSSSMDIAAVHGNDVKLDLDKMLKFDDFNFAHDFCGITRHIDRNTGKLLNCFLPRCTKTL